MNTNRKYAVGILLTLLLPAAARAELGLFGWGPRVGIADDPDQIVVGLHQDLGEFVPRVRFQPSYEVGFGDDFTIVSATIPVHYRFETDAAVQPYAGGGVRVAWIDRDKPRAGSDLDIAPVLVGGAEWTIRKGSDVFLELQLAGGDAHDAKLVIGWMLRAR